MLDETDRDDPFNGHWHLTKRVSYAHIIATIVMLGGLIAAWVDLNVSISKFDDHLGAPSHAVMERRVDMLEQRMAGVDVTALAINAQLEDIKVALIRIEDRINDHDTTLRAK